MLSSTSKVVLNELCDHEMTSVDDPIVFSEMLVTKTKELLEGTRFQRFFFAVHVCLYIFV